MQGIRLLSLQLRNFLSYGDNLTTIKLNVDKPTLIIGENQDVIVDGEYDNNGAGKTTILNALSYVNYGKTVSKFDKIDDIINNINKKNLYTSVTFEANNKFYMIERWRKNRDLGGTGVRIKEAKTLKGLGKAEEKTPAGRTVDEYITNEILRMPFDIFVRIVVYSASFKPFLSLPTTSTNQTSQTSILEELFGHKELTEKAIKLKPKIKALKADIDHLIELNKKIVEEVDRYDDQLEQATIEFNEWDVTHAARITELESDISELEVIDFEDEIKNQKNIDVINSTITEKTTELNNLKFKLEEYEKNVTSATTWDTSHADDLENAEALLIPYSDIDFDKELEAVETLLVNRATHADNLKTLSGYETELDDMHELVKKLDDEIKILKASKCPYCSQPYTEHEDVLETKESELVSTAHLYTGIQESANTLTADTETLLETINNSEGMFDDKESYIESKNAYTNLVQRFEDLKAEENPYTLDGSVDIDGLNSEISVLDDDIAALTDAAANLHKDGITLEGLYHDQTRLESLKQALCDKRNETNPHASTIDRLKKAFESMDRPRNEEVDEMKNLLLHQEYMLKLLTRKDSFARQALLDVNLPFLNKQLRQYLDAIGLPHKVEFTKGMVIEISQFNNVISYSNLSGGQQARINIAIAFAFRDVVQARHQKINFCILDECLDTGLSNLGVKMATKMIKQIAEDNDLSMYVITHRDEIKSSFDNKLKATLKGGLTTVSTS